MIENLKGIRETVNYHQHSHIRLYINQECEHYPLHWHADMEILCPLEGGYSAICSERHFRLQPGEILLIAPGTLHDLPAEPSGKRIIFQVNFADFSTFHEIDTLLSLLAPCFLVNVKTMPEAYADIYRLLMEIVDLYRRSPVLSETSICARVLEIIALLGRNYHPARAHTETIPTGRKRDSQMIEICNYISAHCTESLTLAQMAEMAGFSRFYFEKLFKRYTGISFYQFLIQKRISLAERLLSESGTTITEVALHCGFSSGTAFARSFRQAKGYSPSKFRSLHNESPATPPRAAPGSTPRWRGWRTAAAARECPSPAASGAGKSASPSRR